MTETDGRRPGDRVTHKLGRAVSLCASALRSSRDFARGYQARLTDAFGRHGKTDVLLRNFALRSTSRLAAPRSAEHSCCGKPLDVQRESHDAGTSQLAVART